MCSDIPTCAWRSHSEQRRSLQGRICIGWAIPERDRTPWRSGPAVSTAWRNIQTHWSEGQKERNYNQSGAHAATKCESRTSTAGRTEAPAGQRRRWQTSCRSTAGRQTEPTRRRWRALGRQTGSRVRFPRRAVGRVRSPEANHHITMGGDRKRRDRRQVIKGDPFRDLYILLQCWILTVKWRQSVKWRGSCIWMWTLQVIVFCHLFFNIVIKLMSMYAGLPYKATFISVWRKVSFD